MIGDESFISLSYRSFICAGVSNFPSEPCFTGTPAMPRQDSSGAGKHMLEQIYGVESRHEQPRTPPPVGNSDRSEIQGEHYFHLLYPLHRVNLCSVNFLCVVSYHAAPWASLAVGIGESTKSTVVEPRWPSTGSGGLSYEKETKAQQEKEKEKTRIRAVS